MPISAGQPAPDFDLQDETGTERSLSDYRGKPVVLYFYPKDDTPGCTKEACSLRDYNREIMTKGAVILGVSRDDLESHQRFIAKYNLPFGLLSDPGAMVSKTYGVYKLRNLYGKEGWGIERSTFIIDESGKIQKAIRKDQVDGHTEEVLRALG